MVLAGDELGNTQNGNNNAYCQDNEISWIKWEQADQDLIEFTSKLIHLRRSHPVFSRKHWFMGMPVKKKGLTDIAWFLPEGEEMTDEHWKSDFAKSLGIFLYGGGLASVDSKNRPIADDNFYIMFNAHFEPLDFKLPEKKYGDRWKIIWDTNGPSAGPTEFGPGDNIRVGDRNIILLQCYYHPVKD